MARPFQIVETVAVKHPSLGTRMLVNASRAGEFEPWEEEAPAAKAKAKAPAKAKTTAEAKPVAPAEPAPGEDVGEPDGTEAAAEGETGEDGEGETSPTGAGEWSPDSVPGVGDERWAKLTDAGLTTRESVLAAGVDGVSAVLGSDTLARKVVKAAQTAQAS